MSTALRSMTHGLMAAATLVCVVHAAAQSSQAEGVGRSSGKAGRSFLDVAVGKPAYGTACGSVAGLTCSNNGTSYTVTAGDMFTRNVGIELAYLDLGRANRAGGTVSARGLNLAAVGRVPLNDSFALEARVGTTYGVTHVNAATISDVTSGRDSGFGLGYGVALDVDVTRGIRGLVGWEQHGLHFEGQGMSQVQNVTVGLGYRF